MASSQPEYYHSPAVQNLLHWIQKRFKQTYNLATGHPECGNPGFVPILAVESYLQDDTFARTNELLAAVFGNHESPSPRDVAQNCPRVLCILVQLGKAEYVGTFVEHGELHDDRLPFDQKPTQFPIEPDGHDFFDRFLANQWQFFSPKLAPCSSIKYRDNCILPFTELKEPKEGVSSVVYKATVHSTHDKLAEHGTSGNCYALKVFQPHAKDFKREIDAFKRISKSDTRHVEGVIEFYGGFEYKSTFCILLEYAQGGTLEDYYNNESQPASGEELIRFWTALLKTSEALSRIHHHHLSTDENGDKKSLHGWHQDLKPENILVVQNKNQSVYKWLFKIADLGTSHFREVMGEEHEATALNAVGTRTYGAPEAYSWAPSADRARKRVRRSVDVWSLGGIYSEALIWAVDGMPALEIYRVARKHETDRLSDWQDGNSFHDGKKRLQAVDDQHRNTRRRIRGDDFITGPVMDFMVVEMLSFEARARPMADQLKAKATRCVEDATEELRQMRDSQATQQPPQPRAPSAPVLPSDWSSPLRAEVPETRRNDHVRRVFSEDDRYMASPQTTGIYTNPQADPYGGQSDNTFGVHGRPLSIRQHASGRETRASNESVRWHPGPSGHGGHYAEPSTIAEEPNDAFSSGAQRMPTMNASQQQRSDGIPDFSVDKLRSWWQQNSKSKTEVPYAEWFGELKNRDHILVIDDSRTMGAHWEQLLKLVQPFAKLLKNYDPDKLELYFLSSPKLHKSASSTEIADWVRRCPCNKVTNLNTLLDDLLKKFRDRLDRSRQSQRRSFSQWISGKSAEKQSIYVFTDGVWESGDEQPGHEAIIATAKKLYELDLPRGQIGIQFIRFGNDERGIRRLELIDDLRPFGKDIADTAPADGNVCKMLLGAINPKFDAINSPQEENAPNLTYIPEPYYPGAI